MKTTTALLTLLLFLPACNNLKPARTTLTTTRAPNGNLTQTVTPYDPDAAFNEAYKTMFSR